MPNIQRKRFVQYGTNLIFAYARISLMIGMLGAICSQ